jgi:GNAT superfamily N-acetyltransferase
VTRARWPDGTLPGMTTVRRLGERDWATARAVRLDALADAPAAFGSSRAGEAAFEDEVWRSRVRGSAWFLAEDEGGPAGVVTGCAEPGARPAERALVGLWVAPDHRGRGVGDQLVAAVTEWARGEGADVLVLWVTEYNDAAHGLYRRQGFRPTGRRLPLLSNPTVDQEQWALRLG